MIGIFLESILPPGTEIIHDEAWDVMYGRRPDFRIPSLRLIVEYDGEQHFRQVLEWNSPEEIRSIDCWKARVAAKHHYSTIRIPYTFMRREEWKERLAPLIVSYDIPACRYVDGKTGIYNDHKISYRQTVL
jgi:hypothetical protein